MKSRMQPLKLWRQQSGTTTALSKTPSHSHLSHSLPLPFVLEIPGRLGPSALGFIQRISGAHTYFMSQFLKEINFICAIYSGLMLETIVLCFVSTIFQALGPGQNPSRYCPTHFDSPPWFVHRVQSLCQRFSGSGLLWKRLTPKWNVTRLTYIIYY